MSLRLCTLCFLIFGWCGSALAIEPSMHARSASVKHLNEKIQKLGTGQYALVAVRLKNKTAIAGYVKEAGPDSMVLVDTKTGDETEIAYDSVDRMQGYNLQTK